VAKGLKNNPGFNDLVELMARLRAPGGCPWDREQTARSLTPYIIEEAYELVEAITDGDADHVMEELGDLLFQIVFQAQIKAEQGQFDINDVIQAIHEKMTRRHPHVFGQAEADTAEDVRRNWARIKEAEGKSRPQSVLGNVPLALPSLLRGRRITENAAEVGFDWNDCDQVLEKLEEEWRELKNTIKAGCPREIEEEFGDVLFSLVNLSRFLKLDPERALSAAIGKFSRRFAFIEQKMARSGKDIESATLDEMETYWQEAKKKGL